MQVVVAKINFFDNELTQEIKEYHSIKMAYIYEATYIDEVVEKGVEELESIELIKQYYFDSDMMINIIEIAPVTQR